MAFSGCSSYVRVIFFIKLNMGSSNWKVVIPGVCKRLDTAFQTVPDTGCRGAKKQLCKDSQTVPGLQKKRGSGTHKKAANCQKESGQEKPSFRLFLPACISVFIILLFYTGRSGFNPLIQILSRPFLSARLRSVLSFFLPGAFR